MTNTLDPLLRDLIEWIGSVPKPYREVLDAWRTSCPRLTVWEEATERGYVERRHDQGQGAVVVVTPKGRRFAASQSARPLTS
jgi:hypothetical protein